ncbi:MAG: glycosyltransferase family 39 protein [Chloroflexi bacterium]|nr:glycosyltransferase family 39 protein [Chloroflexota bacterium]MBU1751413.1 glycosyltransferase family 39 protein [Chloroflexota bacterium]
MTAVVYRLKTWIAAHQRATLLGVTLLILLTHLLIVLMVPLGELELDELRYIHIAENLLTTGTFGPEPGVPFALNAPLYPYLGALIFAASGHSLLAVRLVQVLLGTANCLVTFGLMRDLFPRRPGLAWTAMLGVGLYPVLILWEGRILTETLYTLVIQLSCWWWIRSVQRPTATSAVLAGVGFGLSMLTRETLVAFVPVMVAAGALLVKTHRVRYVVLVSVTCLLLLVPWIVRNYMEFGQVFFTDRTAYMVYKLTGYGYVSPFWQEWNTQDAEQGTSPETLDENDLAYAPMRYVWDLSFARQEPVLYARILAAKLLELWGHPNGLDRLSRALGLIYQVGHWALLGLTGLGLWQAWRVRHWPLLAWCLVLPYVTVFSIYFKPNPRYTLPFLPLIVMLAVLGLAWIGGLVGRATRRPVPGG